MHFSRLPCIYQPCLASHVIRSNLPYLPPSKPGTNFYLIRQTIFAHLTSNTMLCDNTFLCPRRLFSSPISSWLSSPQPWEATKLSLFQPPGVHKEPEMGQNHQSNLCCCLDNISPRLAFTSTSTAASWCSIPRPAELVPVSACSCPPRGPQLFHSQVNYISKIVLAKCDFWLSLRSHFTSQERACKCTSDFHSQVTLLRSSSHLGRLDTVTLVSFVAQSSCSCELDTAIRGHTSCCAGLPL